LHDKVYLRDRFNDADTGRFTRSDTYEAPLTDFSSLHKYVYTSNNPINRIDPSGFNSSTLQEQQQANVVLMILIRFFGDLYNMSSPRSLSGLRTQEQIGEFLNLYIPFFENKELVPEIPSAEDLKEKTDGELNDIADKIAGKTLQNSRNAAREDSGTGQSGRSGNNAGATSKAGNGLRQAAKDLPNKHPLKERLQTRAKRYLNRAKADNHKN
jgi:hypothetical protein